MNTKVQIKTCTYLSQIAKIQMKQRFAYTVLDPNVF